MALTLNTNPGSDSANSYVDVAGADAYFEANLAFNVAWAALDSSSKAARLIQAARAIDRMACTESRTYVDQAMAYPRDGEEVIDERIKRAQLEMLIHQYADQDASTGRSGGGQALASANIPGVAAVTFRDELDRRALEAAAGGSLEAVRALLRPWLAGDGFSNSTFEFTR